MELTKYIIKHEKRNFDRIIIRLYIVRLNVGIVSTKLPSKQIGQIY